jgi:predicted TIM-barrel fold metal-dependent hydrolase
VEEFSQVNIPIIDTHQHLVYSDKWTYSWTRGIPQLNGLAFRIDDYLREAEGAGVEGSVFMEASPDEWREEAPYVYTLAAQPRLGIRGVIANCRSEEDGFEEYLESIRGDKLVGLRRTCQTDPDELSQQPKFVENIRRIGRSGLTFDLCFLARQLPIAAALVQKCPGVQFILDHCGVPDIAGGALDPWRDHMRRLAALPNVACKISGVVAYCKPGNATIEAVRPYVEHSIESFGWDRVVWGSDWPVCNIGTTLRQWIAISREIVAAEPEANQHKLFHENAARIYSLGNL